MAHIGKNIRKLRTECGYSQETLGKLVGVTSQAISSWERDRTEPTMGTIELLAMALHCSKSSLLGIVTPTYTSDMQELVSLYSQLSSSEKESIMSTMRLFVQNHNHAD